MMCDDALVKETCGELELASDLYERSLAYETIPLWALRNLICLYWQCSEYGFWSGKGLPLTFVKKAGNRLYELLSVASYLFPDSTELAFWSKYIRWAELGESLTMLECEQLMKQNPNDVTPAVFLYSQCGGEQWEAEAMQLLSECKDDKTVRAGYIISVIESAYKGRHQG